MPQRKLLRRSRSKKVFAGVCRGISEWLGWNVTLVRILFIIGSFIPVIPGFLVYLVLWVAIPKESA
jgi:phage shock protein PspC (stress-responsive transcriptional regulator)